MFPFDAILFDIGGVLLTNGWDHGERAAAAARFGLHAEELEARTHQVLEAWDRGEIDLGQYLDATVFFEPRGFTRQEYYAFMLAQSQPLPDGAFPVLSELVASSPCLIGALNNEARETNEYRFNLFGLRHYFKVAFSSCYLGLRKPEPAMFSRVLDILGCLPKRVLFIDDREENVVVARSAGMKAIHYTGLEPLRAELKTLGVL